MSPLVLFFDVLCKARKIVIRLIVRKKFKQYGKGFQFDPNSTFLRPDKIVIGDDVFIGEKAHFSSEEGIHIGDGVMFGPYPMIIGGDHNISIVGKKMCKVHAGGNNKPIVIENDVWFGARVLILKGVLVGEGSVVGAGSILTKDIPPYCIAFGNPCRPQRPRFSPEQLILHLELVRSSLTVEKVLECWKKNGINA